MTVTIDLVSLVRVWSDPDDGRGGKTRVVFADAHHAVLDGDAQVCTALADAVSAADAHAETLGGDDLDGHLNAWLPVILVAEGPAVVLECESERNMAAWCQAAAEDLTGAGWSGRLTSVGRLLPPSYEGEVGSSSPTYAAVLSLSGYRERTGPLARTIEAPPWRVEPQLAGELVDLVTNWLDEPGGEFYLDHQLTAEVPRSELRRVLAHALGERHLISWVSVEYSSPRLTKRASFTRQGHLLLKHRDTQDHSPYPVTELQDTTRPWAGRCDNAFILSTGIAAHDLYYAYNSRQRGRELSAYYKDYRYLDLAHLPDAFAWQILTDQHLAAAHDLSDWQITPLGDDRYEVAAPNLDDWFLPDPNPGPNRWYTPAIAPGVLDQARRDFGAMILMEEGSGATKAAR